MIFICATDDFPKSRKNAIFENSVKNLSFEKFKCLMFFKIARPVCSRLYFNLIKHFTKKKHLSSKTLFFCIFYQKTRKYEGHPISSDNDPIN